MDNNRRRVMVKAAGGGGVDYVDLGLPSGLVWAVGNLVKDSQGNYSTGAETDWGTYVSWGNIDGHNEGEGYNFYSSTYNGTPGKALTADIPSSDSAHDICLARLGAPWHLPTKEDLQELYDNTDREWTTINGVNGWKFMKKTDHSLYVFFPAAGYGERTSIRSRGSIGQYWTSSWQSAAYAHDAYFSSYTFSPLNYIDRYSGFSVRAVCKPT